MTIAICVIVLIVVVMGCGNVEPAFLEQQLNGDIEAQTKDTKSRKSTTDKMKDGKLTKETNIFSIFGNTRQTFDIEQQSARVEQVS